MRPERFPMMLRTLLVDRFKLAVHWEMREDEDRGFVEVLVIDSVERPTLN